MAHIRHVFKDGTVIEGSLKGKGVELPYNEDTEMFYYLYEKAAREFLLEEAQREFEEEQSLKNQ